MQVRPLRLLVLSALFIALALLVAPQISASNAPPSRNLAPLILPKAQKIAGQYIVVFKPDTRKQAVDQSASRVERKFGATVIYQYDAALHGYAAHLNKKA